MLHTYVPSFAEIGPLVPEKTIFDGFYHIWAWWPSWSCDQQHINIYIHFHVPKSLQTDLGQNGQVVSEKSKF